MTDIKSVGIIDEWCEVKFSGQNYKCFRCNRNFSYIYLDTTRNSDIFVRVRQQHAQGRYVCLIHKDLSMMLTKL